MHWDVAFWIAIFFSTVWAGAFTINLFRPWYQTTAERNQLRNKNELLSVQVAQLERRNKRLTECVTDGKNPILERILQ